MVIGEERSALAIRPRQAEELRVQGIRQFAPVVTRNRASGGVERRTQFADEVLPGAVVPGAARTGKREIGDVE